MAGLTPFLTRRSFLAAAAAGAVASAADWDSHSVLDRIKPPIFPDRDFDITRFDASGDGKKDCSQAIAQAIDACSAAGGGRVVVPPGVFLTGAIHLKSNVNLQIAAQATLRFSRDTQHYLPVVVTRFEGVECMNYSPLIYAYQQTNVAITGPGTLDGQADCEHWWPWKATWKNCAHRPGDPTQDSARAALFALAEKNTPVRDRVLGEGHYLRPSFIQPYACTNVLIEDVTIINSPMWEIHPVLSRNVTVRGVKISSHGPNNDGCDPESCTDVLIEHCEFDTGDDCIAIKSGRNQDGRRVAAACRNIIIRDCRMKGGHGGVAIGSEASGGVRNVLVERCRMDSPHLDRALRIKSNSRRGGVIENVLFRDVTVGQVAEAVIDIDLNYEEGPGGPFTPAVRNIEVRNVSSEKSKYALYLRGYESAPLRDIRLSDCTFDHVAKPNVIENVRGLAAQAVRINGQPFHA